MGYALSALTHPHMRLLSQGARSAGIEYGSEERRRAEPCEAQRAAAVEVREDRLPKLAVTHSITSYPVEPWPEPTFRMLAARKPKEDETHLRKRLCVWPKGGTVIIRPARGPQLCAAAPALVKPLS